MAKVSSEYILDMFYLDLSRLYYNANQWGLLDNSNVTYNGIQYEDVFVVDWSMDNTYYQSVFGGYGMSVDSYGVINGGTATGYLETVWNGSTYVPIWGIENISVDAMDIWGAAETSSLVDDDALLLSLLSGDDTFNGSSYADILLGFDGNDTFYASTGNDLIHGGKDLDTYDISSLSLSELSITAVTDGYQIQSSSYGTDTLYDIESVALSNGTFSLSDLLNPQPVDMPSATFTNFKNHVLSIFGDDNASASNISTALSLSNTPYIDDQSQSGLTI